MKFDWTPTIYTGLGAFIGASLVMLLFSGCYQNSEVPEKYPGGVRRFEDEDAICYVVYDRTIACIPKVKQNSVWGTTTNGPTQPKFRALKRNDLPMKASPKQIVKDNILKCHVEFRKNNGEILCP